MVLRFKQGPQDLAARVFENPDNFSILRTDFSNHYSLCYFKVDDSDRQAKDPFWDNLNAGKINVFEGGDMYSKVKVRATRPPSYNENALLSRSSDSINVPESSNANQKRQSQRATSGIQTRKKGQRRRSTASLPSENNYVLADVDDRNCDLDEESIIEECAKKSVNIQIEKCKIIDDSNVNQKSTLSNQSLFSVLNTETFTNKSEEVEEETESIVEESKKSVHKESNSVKSAETNADEEAGEETENTVEESKKSVGNESNSAKSAETSADGEVEEEIENTVKESKESNSAKSAETSAGEDFPTDEHNQNNKLFSRSFVKIGLEMPSKGRPSDDDKRTDSYDSVSKKSPLNNDLSRHLSDSVSSLDSANNTEIKQEGANSETSIVDGIYAEDCDKQTEHLISTMPLSSPTIQPSTITTKLPQLYPQTLQTPALVDSDLVKHEGVIQEGQNGCAILLNNDLTDCLSNVNNFNIMDQCISNIPQV